MDKKTVVQGGHGPVPMEENSRRYIDADPVEVPMTAYYVRRMLSGELVEANMTAATAPVAAPPSAARVAAPSPSFSKDEDK
jgi:hypothetical protein